MRPLIPLLLACCVGMSLASAVERERQAQELPRTLQQLSQAQNQLIGACAAAGVVFPPSCSDALTVRQTIARDWIRRLADAGSPIDETALDRFRRDLQALSGTLQATANSAQQVGYASQRYAHCLDEPLMHQYREFLGQRVALGLADIAAGRSRADQDRGHDYQRQQRFEAQLQAIETERAGSERFAALPASHPVLRAYLDHCRGTRALTQQPEPTGSDDKKQHQSLLRQRTQATALYEQILQHELDQGELLDDLTAPPDAPARLAYMQVCARERTVLSRQLDLVLASADDHDETWKRKRSLQREQLTANRLTGLAEEWLQSSTSWEEEHQTVITQLAQAPESVRVAQRSRLDLLDREHAELETKIATCMTAGQTREALAIFGDLTVLGLSLTSVATHLSENLRFAEQEENWRSHAQDPTLAKRFAAYQAARTALSTLQNKVAETTVLKERLRQQQRRIELEIELHEEADESLDESIVTQSQLAENLADELDAAIEDTPEIPPLQIKAAPAP